MKKIYLNQILYFSNKRRKMKPDKEIRVCDLCSEYYPVVLEDPDYKLTYLNKTLDLCNNCYDDIVRLIENKKKPKITFK
jgi:hypothetical protein